jgi:hypothetical protein
MESIVHYKRLLVQKYPGDVDVKQLRGDCEHLLRELQEKDPERKQRYKGLGKYLSSLSFLTFNSHQNKNKNTAMQLEEL